MRRASRLGPSEGFDLRLRRPAHLPRAGLGNSVAGRSSPTNDERDRIWEAQKRAKPNFADYEQKAGGRVIPVVVLEKS